MTRFLYLAAMIGTVVSPASAQNIQNNPTSNHGNKFEQLGTILPTPKEYLTASGAPGGKYWQQKADYNIEATLDEKNLMPMYRLIVGKPGSSYTFSIAERIGLDPSIINRARKLVDEDHFRLDKLLNRTEQDLQAIDKEKKELIILEGSYKELIAPLRKALLAFCDLEYEKKHWPVSFTKADIEKLPKGL